MNEGLLKNQSRFIQKILAGAIAFTMTLGLSAFAGCKKEQTPIDSSTSSDISISSPIEDSSSAEDSSPIEIVDDSITFAQFMQEHSEEALDFAYTYIKQDLMQDKMPLSQTWGFHANEDDELTSVSLAYIYSGEENTRILEVANATLINPLDLDKILSGDFISSDIANIVTRENVFVFDAKESYLNDDIASSLANIVGEEGNVKYFKETDSQKENTRTFEIAEETANAINIYSVQIEGTTDNEVLSNIENAVANHTATYPLGDKESLTISTQKYEIEKFAPQNVNELVADYSDELISALDTHFLEKAGKSCHTRSFDASKLVEYTWNLGEGESISQIKFISYYQKNENSMSFAISKIDFKTPILIKELTKKNIENIFASASENATLVCEYYLNFNSEIQGTRDNLINAIFEAHGYTNECPEGGVRYFIDQGASVDSDLQSQVRDFKVIQIQENRVNEFTISIKTSTQDEGYIEKLKNKENYKIYDEKSCEMTGIKIKKVLISESKQSIETSNYTSTASEEEIAKS